MFKDLIELLKAKKTYTDLVNEVETNVVNKTFRNVGRKGSDSSQNYYYNDEDQVFLERMPQGQGRWLPKFHFTEMNEGLTHLFNGIKGDKVRYKQSKHLDSSIEFIKNNFDLDKK